AVHRMGFAAVRVAGPGRSAEPDRRAVQGRGPGVLVRSQHPDRVLRAAAQLVPDDPAQLLLTRVSPQGMAPAAGTRRGRVFFFALNTPGTAGNAPAPRSRAAG